MSTGTDEEWTEWRYTANGKDMRVRHGADLRVQTRDHACEKFRRYPDPHAPVGWGSEIEVCAGCGKVRAAGAATGRLPAP